MWSGSNSGRPRGGAASMGYASLVVWVGVGDRWSGLGFQREDAHISPQSLHFTAKKAKQIGCFACI
jgi:hypothetical protein